MNRLLAAVLSAFALACAGHEDSSGGDQRGQASARQELLVFAAASTRDAMQAIESVFEQAHNVDLLFNFGGSGDLARQIIASPKADVFLSADEIEMDRVDSANLILKDSRHILLSNQLVVIAPSESATSAADSFLPSHLTSAAVRRVSLANPATVPAGRYAKAWLERAGIWSAVESRVLPAVDVRAALAAVEAGSAQFGIVYSTDAALSQKVRTIFKVPAAEGPRIVYPVAAIAGRPLENVARSFVQYLTSEEPRAVFERFGFLTPSPITATR